MVPYDETVVPINPTLVRCRAGRLGAVAVLSVRVRMSGVLCGDVGVPHSPGCFGDAADGCLIRSL